MWNVDFALNISNIEISRNQNPTDVGSNNKIYMTAKNININQLNLNLVNSFSPKFKKIKLKSKKAAPKRSRNRKIKQDDDYTEVRDAEANTRV